MPYKDKEQQQEYQRQYRESHREELRANSKVRSREWYQRVGKDLRKDEAYKESRKKSDHKHWETRKKVGRAKLKARIVEYLGGKCCHCGLVDDPISYDCHHTDPLLKDVGIGELIHTTMQWDQIVEEVNKCVLLCSICHRKLTAGLIELEPDSLTQGVDAKPAVEGC